MINLAREGRSVSVSGATNENKEGQEEQKRRGHAKADK